MLKEGGDGGKMGMVARRGRVRDKLKMWLPKYFKPRGSRGIGQREEHTKESCARATLISEVLSNQIFVSVFNHIIIMITIKGVRKLE